MRLVKARGPGIVAPGFTIGDLDVPQVAQAALIDDFRKAQLLGQLGAVGPAQIIR